MMKNDFLWSDILDNQKKLILLSQKIRFKMVQAQTVQSKIPIANGLS